MFCVRFHKNAINDGKEIIVGALSPFTLPQESSNKLLTIK